MKKISILFLASILLVPSLAFSNMFTFKVGLFNPRTQSDLWEDEFYFMDFTKSNFLNTNFGFSYEYFITREISMTIGLDSYHKSKVGNYLDYVGYTIGSEDWAYPSDYYGDFIPAHSFNVTITPIQLSLKLTPMGRKAGIIPYIGGGVGLYLWTVRIQGDWIDLDDEYIDIDEGVSVYPIYFADAREENKLNFGYHAFGGVMVPFANRLTFEVEFKYNFAKGDLTEAFEGFEPFDLSGYQISLGVNYWF